MNERKCDCKRLSVIVQGNKPDGTDGLLYNTIRTHEEVFGTENNPGGLSRKQRELEKALSDQEQATRMLAFKVSLITGAVGLTLHFMPEFLKWITRKV